MKTILIVAVISLINSNLLSQNRTVLRTIDSLTIIDKYKEALYLYQNHEVKNNRIYYYNIACLFSQLNILDSADYYIKIFMKIPSRHFDLWCDESFKNYRKTDEWLIIDSLLFKEFILETANVKNQKLSLSIYKLGMIDQLYTGKLLKTEQIFTNTSKIYDKVKHETDSIYNTSFLFIKRIIDSCQFWPGITYVGIKSNHYGFLLYQHFNSNYRIEYYQYMFKAFENKEITNLEFAKITDRVEIDKGKDQIYGTHYKKNDKNKLILFANKNLVTINKNRKK
jgi:hypothetical protein